MKFFFTIILILISSISVSQSVINYPVVFKKGLEFKADWSYTLTIKTNKKQEVGSMVFEQRRNDSLISPRTLKLNIIKEKDIILCGEKGKLYTGFDRFHRAYFVYQVAGYCVITYLEKGKTKFNDSKIQFVLITS